MISAARESPARGFGRAWHMPGPRRRHRSVQRATPLVRNDAKYAYGVEQLRIFRGAVLVAQRTSSVLKPHSLVVEPVHCDVLRKRLVNSLTTTVGSSLPELGRWLSDSRRITLGSQS